MKTTPSDASDVLAHNSLYAYARARLMESFDMPCRLRQTSPNKD